MATRATTTLRVPAELRDEIARLARVRGTTMLRVVTDAVHRMSRDEWWRTVHGSLDAMTEAEVAAYRAEVDGLAAASPDGPHRWVILPRVRGDLWRVDFGAHPPIPSRCSRVRW